MEARRPAGRFVGLRQRLHGQAKRLPNVTLCLGNTIDHGLQ
jgi:hypothetical protein